MHIIHHLDSLFPPLSRDYIDKGPVQRLFHFSPDVKGIAERISCLAETPFDRAGIHEKLLRQNKRHNCSAQTLQNIASLLEKDAVIVSCGHQACLGNGPLYVAYKILTAIKIAGFISQELKIKAIPLFWLASDDDDIREIRGLHFPGSPEAEFDTKDYCGMAGFLPSPSSFSTLPPMSAENWGDYHLKLLHQLFGEFGIVTLDPLAQETDDLRRPFFNMFRDKTLEMRKAALARTETLMDRGYKPQVKLRKDDTYLYGITGRQRRRILENTDGVSVPFSTSSLSRLLSLEYSLPLAVEISGPSEIAYHAQTSLMYEALGRTMPVLLPRFSATLIRANDLETLQEADLAPEDIILDRNQAEQQAAASGLPDNSKKKLDNLKETLTEVFTETRETLSEIDPSLSGSADAALRKAMSIHAYLMKKTMNAVKRKTFAGDSVLKEVMDFIFPDSLQERKYNFIFFTGSGRHPGFLNGILRLIDPFDFRHHLIKL